MQKHQAVCDDCGWKSKGYTRVGDAERFKLSHECPRELVHDIAPTSGKTRIRVSGEVTFVECPCGLVLRLESSYAQFMAQLIRDKHASICGFQPGEHAARVAKVQAHTDEYHQRSKPRKVLVPA